VEEGGFLCGDVGPLSLEIAVSCSSAYFVPSQLKVAPQARVVLGPLWVYQVKGRLVWVPGGVRGHEHPLIASLEECGLVGSPR
jgi:hypothetical protein